MGVDEGSSEKPLGTTAREINELDGTARWHESFIKQSGSSGSSKLVVWLVVGCVLVVVLLFIFSA
jgi:hypothetical protein